MLLCLLSVIVLYYCVWIVRLVLDCAIVCGLCFCVWTVLLCVDCAIVCGLCFCVWTVHLCVDCAIVCGLCFCVLTVHLCVYCAFVCIKGLLFSDVSAAFLKYRAGFKAPLYLYKTNVLMVSRNITTC